MRLNNGGMKGDKAVREHKPPSARRLKEAIRIMRGGK